MLWALFAMTFICGMFFGVILILLAAYLVNNHDERVARRNMNYATEQLGLTEVDEYPNDR